MRAVKDPTQATLLREMEENGYRKEKGDLLVSCARATRGLRRPSLDARSWRPNRPPRNVPISVASCCQVGSSLPEQERSRSTRQADSGNDCGFGAIPIDGAGRKIEEVLEGRVDLPSFGVFKQSCYDSSRSNQHEQ